MTTATMATGDDNNNNNGATMTTTTRMAMAMAQWATGYNKDGEDNGGR